MRIFYVAYLHEDTIGKFFDMFKALVNPSCKTSAHVTVRGPYAERQDEAELSRPFLLTLKGVGTFYSQTQNTVYVPVISETVQRLWDKPNYPEYNPHVTVYDGPSRETSDRVKAIIEATPLTYDFEAKGLIPLIAGSNQTPLWDYVLRTLVGYSIGERLPEGNFEHVPEEERLRLAELVWKKLVQLYGATS